MPSPIRRGLLVEGGFRHHLRQHLLVHADGARLFHGQRLADLAAELLQPIIVDLAELFDGDLGAADRDHGRAAESP